MIREATDNMETGISVGSCIIYTIRYANDDGLCRKLPKFMILTAC